MRILFISWDGPGLSYLDSLYVPIFQRLRSDGFEFDVLQFSWTDKEPAPASNAACERAGIGYRRVEIWRRPRPIGPFLSALAGGHQVRRAAHDFGSEVLLPRSILPALAVLAGPTRLPILYDADGLAADERVDFAGLSPRGITYRLLRDIEDRILRHAGATLVRTSFAADVLAERSGLPKDSFFVAPNGRDPELFTPSTSRDRQAIRKELRVPPTAPLITYAGSVGGKYDTARIGEFTRAVRRLRPDVRLLVLTPEPEAAKKIILDQAPDLESSGIFMRAAPADVPAYLAAADLGTAFIKPTFSMRAAAAIKTSEYLLCGVPVAGTLGVGDNSAAVREGVFFDESVGDQRLAKAFVEDVLPNRDDLRRRARGVGVREFSLDRSVEQFRTALDRVRPLSANDAGRAARRSGQR